MMQEYSFSQFEQDVQSMKPRFFDTYILPGFLMFYAVKSTGMRRNARRILFASGVYMAMRNYSQYKELALLVKSKIPVPGSSEGAA